MAGVVWVAKLEKIFFPAWNHFPVTHTHNSYTLYTLMHTQLYNYIVRGEDGSIVTNELPPNIAAPKSSETPPTTAAPISTEVPPYSAAPISTEPPLIFYASMSILDTELLLNEKVSIVILT